jgi:SAM-dependent methyltransferase
MSSFDYSLYYGRYHDTSEAHAQDVAHWLADIIRPNLPAKRDIQVLDVGCGYGFALRAMRDLGFANLMGLEASPQQAARSIDAGFQVEVAGNSTDWLRQHPAQFGLVLLFDVLEHIPVVEQICFAEAIYRCLEPGGRLLLTVPNANALLASRWRYNDYTHYSSFTEYSLDFVLRNAGFTDIRINNSKGIGRFPRRIWRRSSWPALRKWLVRWCWLQVFQAEVPWEKVENISFELNLTALAVKDV